jgi:hypothetical protein
MTLLLFGFLLYHQLANTGFFTEKFTGLEMLCLYGPLLVGISPLLIRAWIGQRNPARPFDATSSLLLAAGSLWLFTVFPFDYSHLADALPGALRFVLAWVTNDIARIVLVLQVVLGLGSAAVTLWRYFTFQPQQPHSYRKLHAL